MTTRKLLFLSEEGFAQEQAPTDALELGSLSVQNGAASPIVLDGATGKITGVAGPTENDHAANKEYVDGEISTLRGDALLLDGTQAMTAALDMDSHVISNVSDPVSAQDAATKAYVDARAEGLSPKQSVEAVATSNIASLSGTMTIDGVALVAEDRVLLTAQTAAEQNGIWVVKAGAWVRPADFSNADEVHGAFVMVTGGTAEVGTGWVCTTHPEDGGFTFGSSAITFVRFVSQTQFSFDDGLVASGNSVSVDLYKSGATNISGLKFESGQLAIKLAASNPSLKVAGADQPMTAGQLDVKIASSEGLEASANGLRIHLSTADANVSVASGLAVTHAPATAPMAVSGEALAAGDPVYAGSSNQMAKGDADADASSRIIGIAASACASSGQNFRMVSHGKLAGVLAGATINEPYYLANGGGLVAKSGLSANLDTGDRVICVGYAMNATDLWVDIKDYGKKA